MRKCRRCTKPATLHITEIRDGEVQALHLCESCAQDYLSNVDVGETVDEEDVAFGTQADEDVDEVFEGADDLKCENCGITFKQFRSQGRLGCPNDYIVFRERLLPLLESIHGETQHVGKCPQHTPDASRKQYELIRLRNDLRSAVESESYEDAARLRDEIQALENQLGIESGEE
ncbi:UvrB/uvrC motif protein [Maioricimonas rarisocia]|uniref:UvrB/uvrC motif protein n=1 Tax=Maioricimonas rarisocia TaxID=2528026 RepID=A0A517Z7N8_9PLAN|nr:UvrB/UvrC motif-containing protein [Maioricimonas rarisocia]QDU38469.1 UvrB/uvrC motif protein [Maioricimonas rarisocia]